MVSGKDKVKMDAAEKEAAAIFMRRAKRKIPEFHSLDELNLVPYLDVMVNLIIFMMVVISAFLPLGILSIFPPASYSGPSTTTEEEKKPELNLSVFIVDDGFLIAGIGGAMPPIDLKNGEYDYDTLQTKAIEIKDAWPQETKVIIAARQNIKYEILVKVMDTLRNKGDRALFYNVQLSPGLATGPSS